MNTNKHEQPSALLEQTRSPQRSQGIDGKCCGSTNEGEFLAVICLGNKVARQVEVPYPRYLD